MSTASPPAVAVVLAPAHRRLLVAAEALAGTGEPVTAVNLAEETGLRTEAVGRLRRELKARGLWLWGEEKGGQSRPVTPAQVAAGKFRIRNKKLEDMGHREPPDDEGSPLRAECKRYVREHRAMLRRWGWTGARGREGRADA